MKYLFCIVAVLFMHNVNAQDRFFARTYTSNVLPKGAVDIELWHTSRFGHMDQFYHAQDQRLEVEVGLGNNLQTSVYFNHFQERSSSSNNGTDISSEIGLSNEWKYKISDPTANKIGFALYGEVSIKGGDEVELESKLIFDKNIGKNLVALNIVSELEKEFVWENGRIKANGLSTPIEFDMGYLYNMKPSFAFGVELVDRNEIVSGNGWMSSILFGGPTLTFKGGKWFGILNFMPQIANLHKTSFAPLSRDLVDHERNEARILFGISL